MSNTATDGVVVTGDVAGTVYLDVSADGGQSWTSAGEASGTFRRDLSEQLKGRYGWLIRFRWRGDAGLDRLGFHTTTQVSQTIYPRLKTGGSDVLYRCASRGVAPLLPNFGLPEEELAKVEVRELRSPNVEYLGRSKQSRLAYRVKDNKPGEIVFRIAAPAPLAELTAAARYAVRSPSLPGCDFHLDVSTDDGRSWRQFAAFEVPVDNEYSSGWVYGKTDVSAAGASEALVRIHLYAGGYNTGLIDAELFGLQHTPPPPPLELTYSWRENGEPKTHRERIPAGAESHAFHVDTGNDVVDEFVRLAAP
jgi:hypothetical protein